LTVAASHTAIRLTQGGAISRPATPSAISRYLPPASRIAVILTTGFALAHVAQAALNGKAILSIGLLLAVAAVHTAFARPQHLPILLLAFLPYTDHFPVSVGSSSTLNLTNVLLLLALVAMARAPRQSRSLGVFEYLLFLFMGFATLAFLTTVSAHGGHNFLTDFFRLKRYLSPFVLFFLVRRVSRDRDDLVATLIVLLYVSALVGGVTWWDGRELKGGSIDKSRVGSVLGQANTMGAFLVYYSLPALALFLRLKNRTARILSLAGFLVMVRGMLYTLSRGAYLALGSASAVLLLARNPIYLILAVAVALGAPTYAPWLVPGSVVVRMRSTVQPEPYTEGTTDTLDKSARQRLMLWDAGMEIIREHPWRGVGLNRFSDVVGDYTAEPLGENDPSDAHNAYVKIAAEMGIPALVAMVSILLWLGATAAIKYFKRQDLFDRSLALGVLGSVIGVAVSCMFGSRFSDEALMGQFWVLIGAFRVVASLPQTSDAQGTPDPKLGSHLRRSMGVADSSLLSSRGVSR
jgi:O-Antigen ligase